MKTPGLGSSFTSSFSSSSKKPDVQSENEILLESIKSMSMYQRQMLAEDVLHQWFVNMNHYVSNHKKPLRSSEKASPRRKKMEAVAHLHKSMSSLKIDDDLSLFVSKLHGSCTDLTLPPASPRTKRPKNPAGRLLKSLSRRMNSSCSSLHIEQEDISPFELSAEEFTAEEEEEVASQKLVQGSS
jgi:hypothetical protein